MDPMDLTGVYPILGIDQTPGNTDWETKRPEKPAADAAKHLSRADEIAIDQRRFGFADRQSRHDKANRIAQIVRIVDHTMGQIGQKLDQMKEQLLAFRKLYPPFPPGSKERVEMLQHFNLLKEQIDKLTIPSESAEAAQIMANPERHPDAGDWRVLLSDDQEPLRIRHRPVHTGSSGLDVPGLPEHADDAQLDAMIEKLSRAQTRLAHRRIGLETDVRQQFV